MSNERSTIEDLKNFASRYGENVAYNTLAQALFKSPQLIRYLAKGAALPAAFTPAGATALLTNVILSELAPTFAAETARKIAREFGASDETAERIADWTDLGAGLLTGSLGALQGRLANVSTDAIGDESMKKLVKRFRKNSTLRKLARTLLDPQEVKTLFQDEKNFEVGIRAIADKLATFANADPDLVYDAIKNATTAKELKASILSALGVAEFDDLKKLSNTELTNLLRPMMNMGGTQPEIKQALQKTRNALLEKFSETTPTTITPSDTFKEFIEKVDVQPETAMMQFTKKDLGKLQSSLDKITLKTTRDFAKLFSNKYSPELRAAATSIQSYFEDLSELIRKYRENKIAPDELNAFLQTIKPDEVLTNVRRLTAGLWEAFEQGGGDDIVKQRVEKTISEYIVPFAKEYAQNIKPYVSVEGGSKALDILSNYDKDVADLKRAIDVARSFGFNISEFSDIFLNKAERGDLFRSLNRFLASGGSTQERVKQALENLPEMSKDDYLNFVRLLRDTYFDQVKGLAETDANEKIIRDLTKAFENFSSIGQQTFRKRLAPEEFETFSKELSDLVDEVKNLQTIKSTAFWEQLGKGRAEGSQTAFKLKEMTQGSLLGGWWDRFANFVSGLLTGENVNPRQAEIIAQKLATELPMQNDDILNVLADAFAKAKERRQVVGGLLGGRGLETAQEYLDLFSQDGAKANVDFDVDIDDVSEKLYEQSGDDDIDLDKLDFGVLGPKRKIRTKQGRELEVEDLLARLAEVESAFDEQAVSPKGAIGLFQFMPATAKEYGIDPRDPLQSYEAAKKMILDLLNEFGDIRLALAGYNAGPNRVRRLLQEFEDFDSLYDFLPTETQRYVMRILG